MPDKKNLDAELALLDTFVKVYVKRLGRYPRFAGLGRNGLPHPKIFAACRRFVGEQLTPEQFERVVISSLDSLSPPADLSELWGWWVRVGGSRGNLDWVLELAASLVRTARHPSGMVSLGSVLKQVLQSVLEGGVANVQELREHPVCGSSPGDASLGVDEPCGSSGRRAGDHNFRDGTVAVRADQECGVSAGRTQRQHLTRLGDLLQSCQWLNQFKQSG